MAHWRILNVDGFMIRLCEYRAKCALILLAEFGNLILDSPRYQCSITNLSVPTEWAEHAEVNVFVA